MKKFQSSHNRGEQGSVFIEAMIAVPLFLLIIFILIYFSMVFIVRGLIDDSAQKALSFAVSHPGFEIQPQDYHSQQDCDGALSADPFCQALFDVIELAKEIPSGGLISLAPGQSKMAHLSGEPQIRIPTPGEVFQHVEEAYAQIPFEVEINAEISFMGWPIPVSAKAVGFYETHYSPSIPSEVDCHGYTYLHPKYRTLPCDCSAYPNSSFDMNKYQCVSCQFDRSSTNDPPINYSGKHSSGCYCPSNHLCVQLYGVGSALNAGQCRCQCKSGHGFTGGYESPCSCGSAPATYNYPSGQVEFQSERQPGSSGQCECFKTDGSQLTSAECQGFFPDITAPIQVAPNKCSCRCTPGNHTFCEGTGGTVGYHVNPAVSGCICSNCGSGKSFNTAENKCECNSGPQYCGPYGQWNENTCKCECFGDCNGWDVLDPETCACNCPGDGYSCDEPYSGPGGPG